jgi:hypothetical protein
MLTSATWPAAAAGASRSLKRKPTRARRSCFCYPTGDLPRLCDVPPDPGPCAEHETRYYRDAYTGICKTFSYGGCLGNWNNFHTKEACEAQCGQ